MSGDLLPTNLPSEGEEKDGNADVIPEEVEVILRDLPEVQQKAVRAVIIGVSYQRAWKGPLPPPDILKEYNDAFSNGAERIFLEAKKQTDHRIKMESIVIPEEQKQSRRGQTFGFILALAFLIASFTLIFTGHEASGTIIGSIDLVALVAVFVYGRNYQKSELETKR
jgi:uncharacterized membrane protein